MAFHDGTVAGTIANLNDPTGPTPPMYIPVRAPRILVILAHPMLHASRVNRAMAQAARAIPNVTVHDLYETYPDFHIEVAREQALLKVADLVVFQHPILWYSMPSLLKEWVDGVLEAGWAHGENGTALQGKSYWLAVTTGSPESAYRESGLHRLPFDAYLPQYRQTAALCGMHWESPLVLHGAHQIPASHVAAHVSRYGTFLTNWTLRSQQPD